jgi:hypothetical protein
MLDYLSLCVTPLRLFSGDHPLSNATGYFYSHDGAIWLVSNWHVYAGRNPRTGQPLSKTGATPDRVEYWTGRHVKDDYYEWDQRWEPLVSASGDAQWRQHPSHGQNVDVAALSLGARPEFADLAINTQRDYFAPTVLRMGAEVFLLGYPLAIEGNGKSPIWKRGSLATFPEGELAGRKAYLIDSATREGMSGAPVIFPETMLMNMHYGGIRTEIARYRLGGTYSGRFEKKDELGASLAVAWHSAYLDEILSGGRNGDFVLQDSNSPI